MSKPKGTAVEAGDMFQPELEALLDQRQGLYKLANMLPWAEVVSWIEPLYSDVGRPGLPVRLLRDFQRRCGEAWRVVHAERLGLIKRVLSQKNHDRNKVYSLRRSPLFSPDQNESAG